MKKKLIIIIATCMMTLALAACKNSEENVAPTSEPTMTSTLTPEPTPVPEPTPTATLIPEIVTTYEKGVLTENGFESEWMNLRYTKPEGVVMVSQEELDALMKQTAQWMYGEDAEEKLDYAALTGEVRDLNLTFPENYSTPDLAGQAVVFTVTVNEVKEEVEAEKQSLIEEYTNMASYYGSLYGLDTETAIRYFLGFDSVEEFEAEMGNYAYDVVKNNMIVRDIAAKENIELTDEIYNAKVAEYSESYGYEDAESFVEAYGEDVVRESLLAELVMEFIIDNAVITDSQ